MAVHDCRGTIFSPTRLAVVLETPPKLVDSLYMTATHLNELTRRKYLEAMGISTYVSRGQLPGAAPTRRLVVVRQAVPVAPASHLAGSDPDLCASAGSASIPAIPRLDGLAEAKLASHAPDRPRPAHTSQATRFSLAAIFVGGVAWVEELPGRPLAREQVKLIQAMARAIGGDPAQPGIAQFDWPMHNNHQLDLGPEAARAGVAGFLQRQIEQRNCRGLVLLGESGATHVPAEQFGDLVVVRTHATQEMLENPPVKRQVWTDLQPLVQRG